MSENLLYGHERGNTQGWTYYRIGKSWFFEQTVTFDSGSSQNVDLDFPRAVQLNRIEQVWNDATSKDFAIRFFATPDSTYYSEVVTETGNVNTSWVTQLGTEYKFTSGSRLRLNYANYTADKTVNIVVQADEL